MGECDYPQPRFWPPKDQAMQELGMDNQNPILASGAIPGLADQGNPLVDLRSPLTPILAPDPSLHQGVLDPYDPRPWIEDSFAVNKRATTPIAPTNRNPNPNAIYIVTSKSESLDQLESGLTKAGANTIQLDEGSTLTDLVARIKVLTPTGGFSAIHLLGHGSEGQFFVGKETLTSRNLWRYKAELKELGTLLTENGDLLVYGCETGKGTAGQRLIDGLAKYTRADVAASDDRTYSNSINQTSDWDLEIYSGKIDAKSDHLTGIDWNGSLGPVTYSNKRLSIDATNSTGLISIKATSATKVVVSGFGNTIEQDITGGVDEINITEGESNANRKDGPSIKIDDIDLDADITDNSYPDAYKLTVSLNGYYNASIATAASNSIGFYGDVKTHGGDVTITNKGMVSIEGATINTRRGTGGVFGNINIDTTVTAKDIPLMFWFPNPETSVQISNTTINAGNIAIKSNATTDPYLTYGASGRTEGYLVDNFAIDSIIDTALYGFQNWFVPAVVKVGSAKSSIKIESSSISAEKEIKMESKTNISLEAQANVFNSTNLISNGLSAMTNISVDLAFAVTKADSDSTIRVHNSTISGKNISATSNANNSLSTKAQIFSNYGKSLDVTTGGTKEASGQRGGYTGAFSVGKTNSTIGIDNQSTLKAVDELTLIANAAPSLDAKTNTTIWGDGVLSGSTSVEVDHTHSSITIDGNLSVESPAEITGITEPINLNIKRPTSVSQETIINMQLATGTVIRGNWGQGQNEYFTYKGGPALSWDLRNKDLSLDINNFSHLSLDRFETGSSIVVGDKVTTTGLTNPGFTVKKDINNIYGIKGNNGEYVNSNSFSIAHGDYFTWDDNNTYQYTGESREGVNLNNNIIAINGELSLATSGKWQVVPILAPDQSYTVTAINKGVESKGDQLVLAIAKPHDINGEGATGSNYEVYKSKTEQINGASDEQIDIANNEIQFAAIENSYTAINSGQRIDYYLLQDTEIGSNNKPQEIEGLESGHTYYAILRGEGRIALAATLEDVWLNKAIDITELGTGKNHFFRYEEGKSSTTVLSVKETSLTSSLTQKQQDKLVLSGKYNPGDRINLRIRGDGQSNDIMISYTVEASKTNDDIRKELVASINNNEDNKGAKQTVVASIDLINNDAILLTAETSGKGYQLRANTINAERVQSDSLSIAEGLKEGDSITINFHLDTTNTETVDYTVKSTSKKDILNGILLAINNKNGLGVGEQSVVSAEIELDQANDENDGNLRLVAKNSSKKYTITVIVNNASTNLLEIKKLIDAYKDPDNTQSLTLQSLANNIASSKETNQIFEAAEKAPYASDSCVTITSGLLKNINGYLYGADFFLSSDNGIMVKDGSSGQLRPTIKKGKIVYIESRDNEGKTTGAYYRYTGNIDIEKSGNELRDSISNANDQAKWRRTNGGVVILRATDTNAQKFRLEGADSNTPLEDVVSIGSAQLRVQHDSPYMTFEPSKKTNSVNDSLTLEGLGLDTGDIITIYNDRNYTAEVDSKKLVSANTQDWQANTNIWANTEPPTSSHINANGMYEIQYFHAQPGIIDTQPVDNGSSIVNGSTIYAKLSTSTSGQKQLKIFSDKLGSKPINRPTTLTQDVTHYLLFETKTVVGASGIRGINPGQELRVLALGDDQYQVATSQQEYLDAIPRFVLGSQMRESNTGSGIQIINSNPKKDAITLTTTINAKNLAFAASGTGSNPKMRDIASNPLLIFPTIGFGSASIAGQSFREYLGVDFEGANKSVSPSFAINVVEHKAITTLNGNITTQIPTGVASPSLQINNTISQDYTAWSEGKTSKDQSQEDNLGVLAIAYSHSNITNSAQTFIGNEANIGQADKRFENIEINNAVSYPSKFMSKFGSEQLVREWAANPINSAVALSGINFVLMENGFNSYAIVSNKAENRQDKPNTSPTKQMGNYLAGALAGSSVILDTTSQIKISGRLYAKNLTQSNTNTIDSVLGAGNIYCDIGVDSFLKGYLKKAPKEIFQWANVGQIGVGVTLNVERSKNTADTEIGSSANINLTGKLSNTSKQVGKVVHVTTGLGSSNDFGLQGGVDLTLASKDFGEVTGFLSNAGASISANKLQAVASNDLNRITINGMCQFSESIGIGAVLVFSDIERRTRNQLSVTRGDQLAITESIDLDTSNSGSITLVAIAGTLCLDDSGNETYNTNNNGRLDLLRGADAANGSVAAAGSIGWSKLNDQTKNSVVINNGNTTVPSEISLTAINSTAVNNWGGAIAVGWTGLIAGQTIEDNKKRALQMTMAGAIAVNQIKRDTVNRLEGLTAESYQTKDIRIELLSDTRQSSTTAGAISLSMAGGSSLNMAAACSIAINKDLDSSGSHTSSIVDKLKITSDQSLSLTVEAFEGADAKAIAGDVGINLNLVKLDSVVKDQPTITNFTLGASAAVNELDVETQAQLANSKIKANGASTIHLSAQTDNVDMTASAISGVISGAKASRTAAGAYGVALAGSGASNDYANMITAEIINSSITTKNQAIDSPGPSIAINAESDEELLAIAGDLSIAVAQSKGIESVKGNGSLSMGTSTAENKLFGDIRASIDGISKINANQLGITAADGTSARTYAISGAISGAASDSLGETFSFALAGAGAANTVHRPVAALIGHPESGRPRGDGEIKAVNLRIQAQRTDGAVMVADAAAASLVGSTGRSTASIGISGGVALNRLSGGITSGAYSIQDLSVTGNTTISSKAVKGRRYGHASGTIRSFAGGFSVSMAMAGKRLGVGGALGLAIAENHIDDSIQAQIKSIHGHNGSYPAGIGTQISLGSVSIGAENLRLINAVATGDAIAINLANEGSRAGGIGAAIANNNIKADVTSNIDLEATVELNLTKQLDLSAIDASQLSATSVAAVISAASTNQLLALSLAGGGANAENALTSQVNASLIAGSYRNSKGDGKIANANTTIQAATQTTRADGSIGQQRTLKAITGEGSLAIGISNKNGSISVSIGASTQKNTLMANYTKTQNTNLLTAALKADSIELGGSLTVMTNGKQEIQATAVSIAVAVSCTYDSSGPTIAISGTGTSVSNHIYGGNNASVETNSQSQGNNTTITLAGDLNISSTDSNSINSFAGAYGIALAIGMKENDSIAIGIGATLSDNEIRCNSKAEIANFQTANLAGNITLTNNGENRISASSSAAIASIAIANQGYGSLSFAGTGARSTNTVLENRQALITNTNLGNATAQAKGTIAVRAVDSSEYNTDVVAVSAAFALSKDFTLAIGGGVTLGRNYIGEQQASEDSTSDANVGFDNLLGSKGNLLRAAVTDSDIVTEAAMQIESINQSRIRSNVNLASLSGSFSSGNAGGSISLTAGGSEATNHTLWQVHAFLGETDNKTIHLDAGALTVSAYDRSHVDSRATGSQGSLSVGGSTGAGALTVNVVLANNRINNSVNTALRNISNGSKVTSLNVSSKKDQRHGEEFTAQALAVPTALTITGGTNVLSITGNGGEAINTLLGDCLTKIEGVNLRIAGSVDLNSNNSQRANASGGAGTGAVAIGPNGGALAVGAIKVQNLLGIESSDPRLDNRAKVQTMILDSNLITTGESEINPSINAASSSDAGYRALAVSASAAITTGQGAGAFSGAFNDSRIAFNVATTVSKSNIISAGTLSITSNTDNNVDQTRTDPGSAAATINKESLAIAVAASDNRNLIDNLNTVTVSDGDSNTIGERYRIQSYGDTIIKANDIRSNINDAESATAVVSGGLVSLSGGGAGIYNTIANTISTVVKGAIDINSGLIGDATIGEETIQRANTTMAQQDNLTISGHFNSGDKIVITLTSENISQALTYEVTKPTSLAIRDGLIEAINAKTKGSYTAAASNISTNTLSLTRGTANSSFTSDLKHTILGQPVLQSETLTSSNQNTSQVNQIKLVGTYNIGDRINLELQEHTNANTKNNTNITYTVTSTDAATIRTGLIEAINTIANTSYAATAQNSSSNGFTLTNKKFNQAFNTTATVTVLPSEGSITLASSSSNANVKGRIITNSLAISFGASVGVGVVENTINNSVTTFTQSSSQDGKANSPTFTSGGNITIASSTAETIEETKTITVAAASILATAVNRASANITSTSRAQVRAGSLYTPGGTSLIQATANNSINSSSLGGTFGAVAGVGIMLAESNLGVSTGEAEVQALLGSAASVSGKDVMIISSSRDNVYADTISAAGGFFGSGAGAQSKATTQQTVQSKLDANATINATGNVNLASFVDQTDEDGNPGGIDTRAVGIAVSIPILSLSCGGATSTVSIKSKSLIDLDNSSQISATKIDITANNKLKKNKYSQSNDNSLGVLGNGKVLVFGALGVSGMSSSTEIGDDSGSFGAFINLGANATVHALGKKASPGQLVIHASTDVYATDDITLDTISALAAATGESKIENRAKARIVAGTDAKITNDSGDILITAKNNSSVSSSSSVLAGLLGLGNAKTTALSQVENAISLHGAVIKGQTIKLWSGLDANGVPNILRSTADSQFSAIGIGVIVPTAEATSEDTNSITISNNAKPLARGNVEIKAQGKDWNGKSPKRAQADATAGVILAVPISCPATTTDRTNNSIMIDSSSQVNAGAQHQLKIYTLSHTDPTLGTSTILAKQNSYLNLTGSNALPSILVENSILNPAQHAALGLDGNLDYSYRVLASKTGSTIS